MTASRLVWVGLKVYPNMLAVADVRWTSGTVPVIPGARVVVLHRDYGKRLALAVGDWW